MTMAVLIYLSLKLSIFERRTWFRIMKLFMGSTTVRERIKVCKFPLYQWTRGNILVSEWTIAIIQQPYITFVHPSGLQTRVLAWDIWSLKPNPLMFACPHNVNLSLTAHMTPTFPASSTNNIKNALKVGFSFPASPRRPLCQYPINFVHYPSHFGFIKFCFVQT